MRPFDHTHTHVHGLVTLFEHGAGIRFEDCDASLFLSILSITLLGESKFI